MELSLLLAAAALLVFGQFPIHDENRPQPKVVDPGPAPEKSAVPPSDAVVLFDGTDLAKWRTKKDGSPANGPRPPSSPAKASTAATAACS